jgi:FeS assembly SUF system protein
MNFFTRFVKRDPEMDIKNPGAPGPEPEEQAVDREALREMIVKVLHTVYDPEIPVDIYELGLIYSIEIDEGRNVQIRMTLTAPGCPVADILPGEVEAKVRAVHGVRDVRLELVWEPAWDMTMMSEAARLTLGF